LNIQILRSNPISPDPRVEKIGKALATAGYTVCALGWDRTGKLPKQEDREGLQILRLCIQADYGKGIGNLPQLLRWQLGLWRWLIKHRADYDLIHACDFDTILPALWLKTFFHKKVVYDIFDFYADHLRATPELIKKMIRQVDLWAIGKADALILVDDTRIDQVAGSEPKLTAIIYNSPEDTFTKVAQRTPQKSGHLRLAYIGLLQIERGLMEMITVLARHPEWHLDLAGFGGDEDLIIKKSADLPNIHWHGRVDYQKAMELSAIADILFATYDPAIPNHKYSSPNKIFEAMMLGKPVIVAAGTNMDRMIAKADCGKIIPYGNVAALETALSSLASSPEMVRRLGMNARKAYETTYAWSIMSQRLIQLYEKVIAK
jgi:glycosyltransferase involved in cell wall biosynthesis